MFFIATALLAIDLANYVTVVTSSFIHNPETPLDTRYRNASDITFDRVVVIDALYGYMDDTLMRGSNRLSLEMLSLFGASMHSGDKASGDGQSSFYALCFWDQLVINNIPAMSAGISAREDLSFADLVFTFSTSIVVGCYPTLIVILAHSKRTVLDAGGSTTLPTLQGSSDTNSRTLGGGSSRHLGSQGKNTRTETELCTSLHHDERESHEGKAASNI
ncbi:hypothetical protein DXG01_003308 [Tephrocybe rancida]|nr:hypothetical protein DXG01_003308 [Tephrocybe rancida]